MDEKTLVQQVLAGDEKAKTRLYRMYSRRLFATAVHFLGIGDAELEDVVQDTYVAAYARLDRFEFRSSLYTWLNHICVNQCFDRLRKRKRHLLVEEEKFQLWMDRAVAGSEAPQQKELRDKEQKKILREQMAMLGGRCQELLEWRLQHELPFVQIARKMKMRIGTVTSTMSRCRKGLEKLVKKALAKGNAHA